VPYLLDITGFSARSRRVAKIGKWVRFPLPAPFHLQGIYDRVLHAFESPAVREEFRQRGFSFSAVRRMRYDTL
jgi:hypothetical protein